MDMSRKTALAVILVMMFSFGSFSSMQLVGIEDTFETQGRQTQVTDFSHLDENLTALSNRWNLEGGLQAAIYYNGSLVYAKSFGFAHPDNESGSNYFLQNSHTFRLASLSKAITASAIHTLVASGELSLDDKMVDLIPDLVPDPIRGCAYPQHPNQFLNSGLDGRTGNADDVYWGIHDINVSHLLNMQNGLGDTPTPTTSWHYKYHWIDNDTSWEGQNNTCIDHETIAEEFENGRFAPVLIESTIRETLRLPMASQPGTGPNEVYSNIGYRIMGEIIERKSGMEYEDYVHEHVLSPMGINNMEIGQTKFHHQSPNQVTYFERTNNTWFSYFPVTWDDQNLDFFADEGEISFGNNTSTPTPYGGSGPIEQMAASGGWVGNAASYARFISHLDETIHHEGFENPFNFTTTSPYPDNSGSNYGAGVRFFIANNETWWHTGSLPGTATNATRKLVDNESVVMVLLTNTRPGSAERRTSTNDGTTQINYWTDMGEMMDIAFTTIDYRNATPHPFIFTPLTYDPSSPCPPGTSEEGNGSHVLLFGTPPLRCYYDSQLGKKGPVYDNETGWQKCPEGTSTSGVGEPNFYLKNKNGGYIICYLKDEYKPENTEELDEEECPEGMIYDVNMRCVESVVEPERECPEGQELDENGRCVDERTTDTPSVSVLATISMVTLAAFSQRRRFE